MSLSRLQGLVSQSDRYGVPLATLISETMSPEELARAEKELASEIRKTHEKIAEFMSEIHVPSVWEIIESEESERAARSDALDLAASDE